LVPVQVEELSGRRFLPEEEVQSVEFMKQMERLGSLPAARSAETPSHRYTYYTWCLYLH